jgi:multiple sugar transport system permease protein
MMAATVMITAPLVVMFLLAQQKFIEGITFTGVRG